MSATPSRDSGGDFPWWLVAAGLIAVAAAVGIASSELYLQVLRIVGRGIGITVFVTIVAFALASALKHVAADLIQDSHFGCCVIHCGSKENHDGQASPDGVA